MPNIIKEIWRSLDDRERKYLKAGVVCIITFGFISIIVVPLILTNSSFSLKDYTKTGNIGDTIGGISAPFIGIMGAVLTFFAFYIQYKANKLVQDQFNMQQFESQYFKMIDIYRDNINEWNFKSRISKDMYNGKATTHIILSDFNTLCTEIQFFFVCNNVNSTDTYINIVTPDYLKELKEMNSQVDSQKWIRLELAYLCLFFGVDELGRTNIFHQVAGKYNEELIIKLLNFLSHKPAEKGPDSIKFAELSFNYVTDSSRNPAPNNFTKFYNGNQNLFAHYYRHLYNAVNFVNNAVHLDYHRKWEYVKLLRTQLSNSEQILFFLNSISLIGRDWEISRINNSEPNNLSYENNRLVTKHDLIKNIPRGNQELYCIFDFYPHI